MTNFKASDIVQNAMTYYGLKKTEVSKLCSILQVVIAKSDINVLVSETKLRSLMAESDAAETDILKVCLISKVSGFDDLIHNRENILQADLDRFVVSAERETGFDKLTVLELTSDILYAAGLVSEYSPSANISVSQDKPAYVIPTLLYRFTLNKFHDDLIGRLKDDKGIKQLDFGLLEPLVAMGLPKAQYYMGYCMLKGIDLPENSAQGLELLHEAAQAGDIDASAVLGDYYYGQEKSGSWSTAYSYYTGYGALALNAERQAAVTTIFNQRIYNKKMITACFILFGFIIAAFAAAPAAAVYTPHLFWGILCVIAEVVIIAGAVMHYKIKPYDFIYPVPLIMFIIWMIYMIIRVLF